MNIELNLQTAVALLQGIGLPVLLIIMKWLKKIMRSNMLYHFRQEALVYALRSELKNGFYDTYTAKLKELKDDAKFIEDK